MKSHLTFDTDLQPLDPVQKPAALRNSEKDARTEPLERDTERINNERDGRPMVDLPMRGFLRVVFAH